MPEEKKGQDIIARDPNPSGFVVVFKTLGDTTWRMFVPVVGLLLVGKMFDDMLGTKPWLLLMGAGVGSLIAAYLVRRQLRSDQ